MADHVMFRKSVKSLRPEFKFITRNTLKADCLKMYEKEKDKVYNALQGLSGRVSLTYDMWTSNTMNGYLCLTCHYIDNDWKLQKKILNFLEVQAPHTGEIISKVIIERLYDWHIDEKIFSITLDNCTTNDVVAREVMKVLQSKKCVFMNGDLVHMHCCAHILNLIVQDGLGSLRDVIFNIRESIKFVKSSQARLGKFKKIAKQVNAPHSYLFYDVPTRWNSTYLMLENALKFKNPFKRMSECDSKFLCAPFDSDWENAKVVVECLKVFYEITERLSASKYPTSNVYFNDVCDVYLSLKVWYTSVHPFVMEMTAKMLVKFEKYWGITNIALVVASVLDPRYKLKSIQYYFKRIYEDEREAKFNIRNVRSAIMRLYDEYLLTSTIAISSQSSLGIGTRSVEFRQAGMSSSFKTPSTNRLELERFIQESTSSEPKKSEMETYLEELVHPGINDEAFDILAWWKHNGVKYPVVSRMARDILAFSSLLSHQNQPLAPEVECLISIEVV